MNLKLNALEWAERNELVIILKKFQGNIVKVAQFIPCSHQTVYTKIKKFKIVPEDLGITTKSVAFAKNLKTFV